MLPYSSLCWWFKGLLQNPRSRIQSTLCIYNFQEISSSIKMKQPLRILHIFDLAFCLPLRFSQEMLALPRVLGWGVYEFSVTDTNCGLTQDKFVLSYFLRPQALSQGVVSLKTLEEESFLVSSQFLLAACNPWCFLVCRYISLIFAYLIMAMCLLYVTLCPNLFPFFHKDTNH
jgi:hypothetical protein